MKRQDKQLPDPNGPLFSIIPAEAIRDANDAHTLLSASTMLESLTIATANRSSQLVGSLLHDNSSPTTATQISLYNYLWYPLTTASTENNMSHMVQSSH